MRPLFEQRGHTRISQQLDELIAELGAVHGQARRSLKATAEVEERDHRSRLVDPALVPAGRTESVEVSVLRRAGCLGQLFRVAEKRASLRVELIGRPGGRELVVAVLQSCEAAQGRRVQAES